MPTTTNYTRDIIAITVIIVMGILVGIRVMPYNYFINIITFILGFYFGYNIPTQISLYEYLKYAHEDLGKTAQVKVLQGFNQSFNKFKRGFIVFIIIAIIDSMLVLLIDLGLIRIGIDYAIIIIDIISYAAVMIDYYIGDSVEDMKYTIITHYTSNTR